MGEKLVRNLIVFAISISCITFVIARDNGKVDPRIVGGLPADNVSIPYIVSLVTLGFHGCGGSIIDERTILTAAHCLTSMTPLLLKVHVGTKTLSLKEGEVFEVKSIHAHENWTMKTMDNDIGLVRLARPLKFSATVQPIKLPTPMDKIRSFEYATIAGWGTTAMNGGPSQMLRYARVPIMNQGFCNLLMNGRISERMLCAGYLFGGVDSCQMDSGGPLVKDDKIYGIVSWGLGCALPIRPGIYARVQAFLPWLNKTLEALNKQD